MKRRNWKRVRPTSLRHAMELCLEYAQATQNRSVDGVADLMGLTSKWALYKWLANGRLPANLIRPFEHACGITYVTDYLAQSSHRLLVEIPTGRRATETEINDLQRSFSEALGLLIRFYQGAADADDTVAALHDVIGGLGWHRENVRKSQAPELALFDDEGSA